MKPLLLIFFLSFTLSSVAQNDENLSVQERMIDFEVSVYDNDTTQPVENTNVYLFEMPSGTLVDEQITSGGKVLFRIDPYKTYQVRTCHRTYINSGMTIYKRDEKYNGTLLCISGASTFGFNAPVFSDPGAKLFATMGIDEIVVGKTFKLDNIYFPLDKAYLTAAAKKEMNYVYDLLVQYPSLKIEMGSHTDSRASHEYNEDLSMRRAKSTYGYLVDRGIDPNRLTYQGYGETQLVNECADGVKCSEAKHQLNRRTEFKINEFNGKDCVTPTVR